MRETGIDEITGRVIKMITNRFQNSLAYREDVQITVDTELFNELEFDSLMLVVLQIDIEDAFHIRFDPTEKNFQELFSTVRSLSDYIRKQIAIK